LPSCLRLIRPTGVHIMSLTLMHPNRKRFRSGACVDLFSMKRRVQDMPVDAFLYYLAVLEVDIAMEQEFGENFMRSFKTDHPRAYARLVNTVLREVTWRPRYSQRALTVV
jgi:hypothetical protein